MKKLSTLITATIIIIAVTVFASVVEHKANKQDAIDWLMSNGGGTNKTELIKSHVLDTAYKEMIDAGMIKDNIEGKLRLIEEFKKVCK